ncbi:hypothetical protein FJ251_12570 [bacterium]|nr:hypothetical protein [bacterium]
MASGERGRDLPSLGWKERVGLPAWGLALKALVDPVSALSTLAVERIERVGRLRDEEGRLRLVLRLEVPVGRGRQRVKQVYAFYRRRTRLGEGLGDCVVVRTALALGEQLWEGELALVPSRRQYFLHLGRADLVGRFRVDPARVYAHPLRRRAFQPSPLLPLPETDKAAG